MRKHPIFSVVTSLIVLGCASLIAWALVLSVDALASPKMQPPPQQTPIDPPTNTPQPSDTPKPSDTPQPSDTPKPSDTPEPTNTPPSPEPSETRKPKPSKPKDEPKPDPNCQSTVQGTVLNAANQGVVGATVSISNEGLSRTMMTDDGGRYGFGGLCAGSYTLIASLPGKPSPSTTVNLDGKNSSQQDLRIESSGPAPQATAEATKQNVQQPTGTPEPQMPTTGYSGLLLYGGALAGIVLLLLAGARRTLATRSRADGND